MKKRKEPGRQARRGTPAQSVTKTVIAGTIGLSLLQVPMWASANNVQVRETVVVPASGVNKAATEVQSQAAARSSEENAKITKEQAEQKIRLLFPALKDAKLDNVSYSESEQGSGSGSTWMLNWAITKGSSTYYFNTSIDAVTGEVLNYNQPMNLSGDETAYFPAEITREQAEKVVQDFIRKAAPSLKSDDLITSDYLYGTTKALLGPVTYNFSYNVKVNGIPADGEMLNVSVDGKGRVFSYDRTSFDKNYPTKQTSLSVSDATLAFKKDLSIQLAYVSNDEYNGLRNNTKKKWQLAYIVQPNLLQIDAKTGKKIMTDPALEPISTSPITYSALPPSNLSFKPHTGKLLTSKETIQLYNDLAPSSKDYTMSSYLSKGWMNSDKQVWNIYWNKRDIGGGKPGDSVSMNVEAETGQLLNFNYIDYPMAASADNTSKSDAVAITEAKAREKAIEFVERYYPDAQKTLKLSSESGIVKSGGKTSFRYVFQRFYGELPIFNHQVNLVLDADGKVHSYYTSGQPDKEFEKDLAALSPKFTKEDALSKLKAGLGAELRYTRSGGYYSDAEYLEPKVTLSYVPTFNGERSIPYINAVSGETERLGTVSADKPKASLPSDAASHSASKDLATLLEYNVISPGTDGMLHPDAELTYGDLLVMLSKAVYPDRLYYDESRVGNQFADVKADSPYAEAVQMFVERGWLRNAQGGELHPEQKLTRGKLAEVIVDILHYDRLAKFYDTAPSVMTLSDAASIPNKGAVEFVMRLGLMSAKDGKFEPNKGVTKAEAAQFLVLLAHIQGKVDTPVTF
ncbi:YcdB/YcdC domain-containing protein [Paenibacillus sp. SAF-054]|uniref:S-layer homology domain-containing protein n=1 Tax=unclassified Paenibacillus TaxID=185978 RepID=UPI003F80AB6C